MGGKSRGRRGKSRATLALYCKYKSWLKVAMNWRFRYINECICIVCENVWMSFYFLFYVFLFFAVLARTYFKALIFEISSVLSNGCDFLCFPSKVWIRSMISSTSEGLKTKVFYLRFSHYFGKNWHFKIFRYSPKNCRKFHQL